ncbi:MAG: hypothetical protein RL616_1291, partial [Verrucomicrobiota bacterium]
DTDPSVAARMKVFDASIEQMLWPEKRERDSILGNKVPGTIDRTTQRSDVTIPVGFVPDALLPLQGRLHRWFPWLVDEGGDIVLGPIPKDVPVGLLANLRLRAESNDPAVVAAHVRDTGELLPLSIDFSHFAVVKHLVPENFAARLLVRPDLIQHAQQFHFRPFNGHHVQIPITDGRGNLTKEFHEWLPFAEALLKCWLQGNQNTAREIFICPELGPVVGGYCLSTFPNSWEDKKILRGEIEKLWKKL